MRFKDTATLVTGSTTGIGRAVARRIVRDGGCVIVHGRREEAAKDLCAELGDAAKYVLGDLSQAEICQQLIPRSVEKFGRLDGLVNNAALTWRSDIDSTNKELLETLFAVNTAAPLFLTQAAVKIFREQGRGASIVNIGSINAHCGQRDLLAYSMSKGAMLTMTRNLGDALGPEGIRVNQVNVGWTATENEIKLKKREGLAEGWQNNIPAFYAPSGSLLTPENVAEHICFWLSEESAPCNGVVFDLEQFPVIGRMDARQF